MENMVLKQKVTDLEFQIEKIFSGSSPSSPPIYSLTLTHSANHSHTSLQSLSHLLLLILYLHNNIERERLAEEFKNLFKHSVGQLENELSECNRLLRQYHLPSLPCLPLFFVSLVIILPLLSLFLCFFVSLFILVFCFV